MRSALPLAAVVSIAAVLVVASALGPGARPALADEEGGWKVEEESVYHGSADSFSTPATVERDTVFAEISAYRQIEKEGLKDSQPRYWILLQKANDVFKKALEKVADDEGYDLIAEKDSVKGKGKNKKGTPPDATQKAIDKVAEVEKEE